MLKLPSTSFLLCAGGAIYARDGNSLVSLIYAASHVAYFLTQILCNVGVFALTFGKAQRFANQYKSHIYKTTHTSNVILVQFIHSTIYDPQREALPYSHQSGTSSYKCIIRG